MNCDEATINVAHSNSYLQFINKNNEEASFSENIILISIRDRQVHQ